MVGPGSDGAVATLAAGQRVCDDTTACCRDVRVLSMVVICILSARVVMSPVVAVAAAVRHKELSQSLVLRVSYVRVYSTRAGPARCTAERPVSSRHARRGQGGATPPQTPSFLPKVMRRLIRRCVCGVRSREIIQVKYLYRESRLLLRDPSLPYGYRLSGGRLSTLLFASLASLAALNLARFARRSPDRCCSYSAARRQLACWRCSH